MAVPLVAALLGLVVGATLITGAWLLFGTGDSEAVGKEPITAPERIGGYSRFEHAGLNQSTDAGKRVADRVRRWDQGSAERLSTSYHGAAASVATYADDQIENQFTVMLVRARSPFPPFVPFVDPKDLGLERPEQDVARFGDVACTVFNSPVAQDRPSRPEDSYVITCLRTSATLTVQITRVTGDLRHDIGKVAGLVDEAWAAAES